MNTPAASPASSRVAESHHKITMMHSNPARIENGVLRVDRKFHIGMLTYADRIRASLMTVHPELPPDVRIMDPIEVPCADLPYQIMTVKTDRGWTPLPVEMPRLRDEIAHSQLVYVGGLPGTADIARSAGVPYILILEYDLQTQIVATTADLHNPIRRAVRAARCTWNYFSRSVPEMRRAHSLHCNGFPIYDATQPYTSNRLLYLDSRMSRDMLIPREQLLARLAMRGRPFRLLYSGRYERMKGAIDAVQVAVECVNRGLDVEMHFYGQGSLRAQMEKIAARATRPDRIRIHDAIPYPELVQVSRSFDLFVCCHIQSDPSCTYLESFGAGLPIVGYANRMWRRLSEVSGVGLATTLGTPDKVATGVQQLIADRDTLAAMSERALAFAEQHCYEGEFEKRVAALNAVLG